MFLDLFFQQLLDFNWDGNVASFVCRAQKSGCNAGTLNPWNLLLGCEPALIGEAHFVLFVRSCLVFPVILFTVIWPAFNCLNGKFVSVVTLELPMCSSSLILVHVPCQACSASH